MTVTVAGDDCDEATAASSRINAKIHQMLRKQWKKIISLISTVFNCFVHVSVDFDDSNSFSVH